MPGTRGITLIEMLIVVVLIGVLSGIAGSKLDWQRYRTDASARELLTEISKAQRLAVSLQANVRVIVANNRSIQIHEDADNNGAIGTGERVRTVVLDEPTRLGKGSSPDIPGPSDPSELTTVIFRRDGSASSGGTIYLTSALPDASCKRCRAVAVVRATGRPTLYSHSGGTWRRAN
ncbi:MAG TPA: GspH/FimT family pseudopilin [Gemmatimonadales bacterium]|nr:GspH/FimT family pseudopilin [Gemmatimonadales bacterium]